MTSLELRSKDETPEQNHSLLPDAYLGVGHIFRAWAQNPEILEATLGYLETLYDQMTPRTMELVIQAFARARGARDKWHQLADIAQSCDVEVEERLAIGLLVDFYVGRSNYVATVDLPFEGREFVGRTFDEESFSTPSTV